MNQFLEANVRDSRLYAGFRVSTNCPGELGDICIDDLDREWEPDRRKRSLISNLERSPTGITLITLCQDWQRRMRRMHCRFMTDLSRSAHSHFRTLVPNPTLPDRCPARVSSRFMHEFAS